MRRVARALVMAWAILASSPSGLFGQGPEIERPAPPALDDLETDANHDEIPDGWYNLRDGKWMTDGGVVGPHYMRFENTKPGRPARLSRAFGVDGRKSEAIIIGFWVRLDRIQSGERIGEVMQDA